MLEVEVIDHALPVVMVLHNSQKHAFCQSSGFGVILINESYYRLLAYTTLLITHMGGVGGEWEGWRVTSRKQSSFFI